MYFTKKHRKEEAPKEEKDFTVYSFIKRGWESEKETLVDKCEISIYELIRGTRLNELT